MKHTLQRLLFIIVFCSIVAIFGSLAYVIQRAQDPHVQLQKLLVTPDGTVEKALFSPDDTVKTVLIKLIGAEKKRILTAIYTFTEHDIAKAFLAAQERGVELEFVVDRSYGSDRYSKVPMLANNNTPIWVYQTSLEDRSESLMHNKFCIFEDNILDMPLLWTGSYNFTKRASTRNQENVIILNSKDIINQFKQQFEILKARSLAISGIPGKEYKKPIMLPVQSWWYYLKKIFGFAL